MAEETTDLQRLVVSLEARLKTFDRQMDRLKTQTDKNLSGVEKRFQKAETAISGFGKKAQASLSGLGGNLFAGLNPASIVASLGGAGIAAFAKQAVTSLGNIKDQAMQAGLSIKEMQQLTYAAISEGFGANDIVGIFQKLNKELADARVGGGQLADILKANNVPLQDQNGVLRDNKDLFLDIVDLIRKATSDADRQLLTQLAFGRSAGELAPLFNLGADAMRRLMENAQTAGFVVEDQLVNKADEFIDKWTLVAGSFSKLWQETVAAAAVEFQSLFDQASGFDDFLRDYTGKGLMQKPLRDIIDPDGKAGRDATQKRNDALAQQEKLETELLERLEERQFIRQQEQPLDDLGQRRLDILNEEIGRYDRLIKAHKAFMEELRKSSTVLPSLGVQPGLSSGVVKGTVVPGKADTTAARATDDVGAAARKAAADKLALANATDMLFIATQREIAAKIMEAEARGKSVYEMERARKEMELLARLEDHHRQYGGAVTAEELTNVKLLADAWGNVNQEMASNEQALAELQEVGDTVFGGLEDAIGKFIDTGKLDVKAMVASIIKDLAKLSVHNLFQAIQFGSGGGGGGGGSTGGVMGWLANLIPGRSGPLQKGQAVPEIVKAFQPGAGLGSGMVPGGGSAKNPFLDLIGRAEGTDRGRGYNETLGYGKFSGGNRNLTGMSLDEIAALQKQMLAHPDNSFNSSALGRYQITGRTLKGLRGQMGLDGSEKFTPQLQDRMALQLMQRRGQNPAGLKNEWEGLRNIPNADIMSAYQAQIAASGKGLATSLSKVTSAATSSASDFSGAFGPALQSVIGAVGGEGGGAGGFLSLLQPLLSLIPGLAKGGPVRKGQPYIVGENRPELFVPGENGSILPQVPRLSTPRPAMATNPFGGGRQQVDVNIRADASPMLLLETDSRAARISGRGDTRTLRTADRQAPQRMAQFEKLGT